MTSTEFDLMEVMTPKTSLFQFTSVHDVPNLNQWLQQAFELKRDPFRFRNLGANRTLGLIFLNPSLRTRMTTQKAAFNLGMQVMVLNIEKESWALEFEEGAVMNGTKVEHIKDAAAVMGQCCDIIGIRSFPGLTDFESDYQEKVFSQFIKYSAAPVISLESATLHPLQSFADLITIEEHKPVNRKPKVVLTWAPHIKALPQAVPNSFAEWMNRADVDFVITHPEGLELDPRFTQQAKVNYNQDDALADADFLYVKNWSAVSPYGKPVDAPDWYLTPEKMQHCPNAKIMHCLPVRRNVELSDELIDGPHSLIRKQSENRIYAAQTVLYQFLKTL